MVRVSVSRSYGDRLSVRVASTVEDGREICGDMERYGEISGEIPWKTGGITSRCGAMALQMDESQCIAMAGFPSPG